VTYHQADWECTRKQVLDKQNGRCAREDCEFIGSLDVIRLYGEWVGFCRKHRLQIDAAERCNKAARTRGNRRAQRRLF